MTPVVLDASALVRALTESTTSAAEVRQRVIASTVHAPHLIVAEVGSAARRLVLAGALSAGRGLALVESATSLVNRHHPHGQIARLAWVLRANLSYYDALYVALAARLGVPLLTADARLARSPGLPCEIEVIT